MQERQRKRAAEAKNASPAQTAAEATRQMLNKKVLLETMRFIFKFLVLNKADQNIDRLCFGCCILTPCHASTSNFMPYYKIIVLINLYI